MDVKTLTVIGKKNQQQFSMVYALIDHRHDVKILKPGSETTRLRLVVSLEFWTFLRHFYDRYEYRPWKFVVDLLTSAFLPSLAPRSTPALRARVWAEPHSQENLSILENLVITWLYTDHLCASAPRGNQRLITHFLATSMLWSINSCQNRVSADQ